MSSFPLTTAGVGSESVSRSGGCREPPALPRRDRGASLHNYCAVRAPASWDGNSSADPRTTVRKVPDVNVDTNFVIGTIADAIASTFLAAGRRPHEAAAAWIDAVSGWTEPLWGPAGGELAWQVRTLTALSSGDYEYAFRQALTSTTTQEHPQIPMQ